MYIIYKYDMQLFRLKPTIISNIYNKIIRKIKF